MRHNIKIGGLYRCCIQAVTDDDGKTDGEGSVIKCPSCSASVELVNENNELVWTWKRPEK